MAQKKKNNNTDNDFQDGYTVLAGSSTPSRKLEDDQASEKKPKVKTPAKLKVRNFFLILLSIIMIVVGSGCVYYYNTLDSLNYSKDGSFDGAGNYDPSERKVDLEYDPDFNDGTINMSMEEGSLLNDPMVLNVMLFGEDRSSDGVSRSDSMIMLSIDNRHQKLKLTSFMRDMWVYIPDYGYSKLNHAYSYGGAKLSITTIEQNFGVKIDRYAIVDFNSFRKIIDILGGVDIDLTAEEIDYINWQTWKNNQADTRNEITAAPGKVHLNGRQALWYARNRGDEAEGFSGSDFDRTDRQRKLLRTLATDMKSATLPQIIGIVDQIGPLVTTNLKKSEITTLVANSLTYLQYDLVEYRLPSDGNYYPEWHYGMATLDVMDMSAERLEFAKYIYEELVTDALDGYMTYEAP